MSKRFWRRRSNANCAPAPVASVQRRTHVGCEPLESRVLLSAAALRPAPIHSVRAHHTYVIAHTTGQPLSTPSPVGITPSQMRHFYGIDQISFTGTPGDGTGETIALVDAFHDPTALTDLKAFDKALGLADPPSFRQLNQNGGTNPPGTDPSGPGSRSWEVEESLDIQWAHAIAPAANLVLVEASSDRMPDLYQGARTAAGLSGVVAVSMSFGTDEYPNETSDDATFTTPTGHAGVTFLAATGDNGSPGTYPAYSPNVVAIGGTTIHLGPGATYGSESGWSGSGGGTSTTEPEPDYQQSVQSSGSRQTPDVSMDADPASGVPVHDSYDFGTRSPWAKFGGTSLATPMWAALIAIADQGRALAGQASLDGPSQTLPALYALPQADFNDITDGSNGDFTAGSGYDQVTGIGSPVANLLVKDLAGGSQATSPASVVGRYVFYNHSAYDGNDPSASAADDGAIASTQPLQPGSGPATSANYTSYSRGINGIMIDVASLAGSPDLNSFSFAVGNSADPTQWSPAPDPAPGGFLVRPGQGVNGSTRIEFVWPDHAIQNEWLQVTVNADAKTGLASPDVFYFGNLVGEGGKGADSTGQFTVTADDETGARNDPHGVTTPATINDVYDFNKDGKVDAVDQLIARHSLNTSLFDLDLSGMPALAPAATTRVATAHQTTARLATPRPAPRTSTPHPRGRLAALLERLGVRHTARPAVRALR